MNSDERTLFWNTLCSLPGKDRNQDVEKLLPTIKKPRFLYRYRPVSMRSLDALRTNKLYFSSANYYDDPFDTFLHIDIEAIRSEFMSAYQTPERIGAVIGDIKSWLGDVITDEQKGQLTVENLTEQFSQGLPEKFLISALEMRDAIKKDILSVCFSENGFNEVLWLKYANQHKGFVQIYDLQNDDNFLCGKQAKCENCGVKKFGTPLYPICYSDKPYDATNFAKLVMLRMITQNAGVTIPQQLYDGIGCTGVWEYERTSLIKKKCHEYDEEWRMIANCQMKQPAMMEWIPSGIILGLRMNVEEENLVVSMATEAGITTIYKSYIDSNNQLNAYQVK